MVGEPLRGAPLEPENTEGPSSSGYPLREETMKVSQSLTLGLVIGAIVTVPVPAARAVGGPLWVSSAPTVAGNGTSCNSPGFNAIQAAIVAAPSGATIEVCAGTYVEQLTIEKSLTILGTGGSVTIQLPATPAHSVTP